MGIKRWLENLMVREVSMVDRPANKRRFLVLKGDDKMPALDEVKALEALEAIDKAGFGPALESLLGKDLDITEDVLKRAGLDEDGTAKVTAALRILGPDLAAKLPEFLTEKATMTEEEKAAAEKAEAEKIAKAEADRMDKTETSIMKRLAKALGFDPATKSDDPAKDLPEDVQAVIKAEREEVAKREKVLNERIEKAEAEVKKSDARVADLELNNRRTQAIAKCAELKALPGVKADDFAEVMMSVSDNCDEKTVKAIEDVLKSSADMVAKSEWFKQHSGIGAPVSGSAEEEINQRADKLVEKSGDDKLTKEQAIEKVAREDKELYARYTEEQAARR